MHSVPLLASLDSICTESGVRCTHDDGGEHLQLSLSWRWGGVCVCGGGFIARTLAHSDRLNIYSPQPVSVPTMDNSSILGTSSTTQQMAWEAASLHTAGPMVPSRGALKPAVPPPPHPPPLSPSPYRPVRQV